MTFADKVGDARERSRLKELWRNKRYSDAIPGLRNYFAKDRRADVAYWLATSLCKTGHTREGGDLLYKIRRVARTREVEDVLLEQIRNCGGSNDPREMPQQGFIGSSGNLKGMEIRGDPKSKIPKGTEFIVSDGRISEEDLSRRLFRLENSQLAIDTIKRISHAETILISPHFICSCLFCSHADSDLKLIGQGLENYLGFFSQKYGMKKPEEFITIYAATNDHFYQDLAENVHGVTVRYHIIGYSIPDDMSIVAILPSWDKKLYGTLKHELFHLMIRNNFGDAPPWIEEGIAALYESSEFKQGQVIPTSNWREKILRAGFDKRPRLEQLIAMDWLEFNKDDVGVKHAMARYFIMYLESKGKLSEIYNKLRAMEITNSYEIIQPYSETVLEEFMSMKIDKIDRDFVAWFSRKTLRMRRRGR